MVLQYTGGGSHYGHQAWIYVTPIAFPNAMLAVNVPVCKDGPSAHGFTLIYTTIFYSFYGFFNYN